MSHPVSANYSTPAKRSRRLRALLIVRLAIILAKVSPERLTCMLRRLAISTAQNRDLPSQSVEDAERAYGEICAASVRCASHDGCLPRSIAVFLSCRLQGIPVNWRSGFKTDPLTAHAWVELEGKPICEQMDLKCFVVVLEAS